MVSFSIDPSTLIKNNFTIFMYFLMEFSRSELTEALKFHMQLSSAASAVSEFRLLNGAQPITIGLDPQSSEDGMIALNALFDSSPNGGTPLCRHINEVAAQIRKHVRPIPSLSTVLVSYYFILLLISYVRNLVRFLLGTPTARK